MPLHYELMLLLLIQNRARELTFMKYLEMIGVMCLLVHYPYPVHFPGLAVEVVDFNKVGLLIVGGSVLLSLLSAFNYFRNFFIALERQRTAEKQRGSE